MSANIYSKTRLFYGLSTIIPWTLWLVAGYISHIETNSSAPQTSAAIIAFSGLLAPVLITLFLAKGNSMLVNDLKNRFFNFKGVDSTYIILTLVLMPFSILLAQAVSLLFGYSMDQFRLAESFSFTSDIFPVWFILIIAPLLEELAWHTYGTDSLRLRFSLFKTSMLFGLFWAIWHIPLAGINNYYHNNLVDKSWIYSLNFFASIFPFVIIMNWIYYKANRNIILPVLFHISAGFFNEIFATHPMSKVIQTCLLIVFAVYIVANDKAFFFSNALKYEKIKINPFRIKYQIKSGSILIILCSLITMPSIQTSAQTATQTIKGKVFDEITNETIPCGKLHQLQN